MNVVLLIAWQEAEAETEGGYGFVISLCDLMCFFLLHSYHLPQYLGKTLWFQADMPLLTENPSHFWEMLL